MPLQLLELTQLGFEGMRDADDAQTGEPRKAILLQNCYPLEPQFRASAVGRPGLSVTQSVQLGVSGHRTFQLFYQFTKLDGTEYTICICGGLLYKYNWGTATWTNVPLVGVTLPQDGLVYAVTFANLLIVNPNDGAHPPWSWDGTTFASLTNAPVFWGPLTVYDAHLVGIKWFERSTIDWSEVNQPNVGYESGGFNDSWTLKQTDPNQIYAIYGTNEALYYWRAQSIGRIVGGVTQTWSSDGTHDGVSYTKGTLSPAAVTQWGTDVFFLDQFGRPQVISGGTVFPIWEDYRNTIMGVARNFVSQAIAVAYSPIPLVLYALTESEQQIPNLILTIRPGGQNPPASGIWRGWTLSAWGMVKDPNQVPTLFLGGIDGYAYEVGDPADSVWDDFFVGNTQAITHIVQGSYLGYEPRVAKQFDRVRILINPMTPLTTLTFDYQTPEVSETLTPNAVSGGTFVQWDVAKWDVDVWSTILSDAATEFGIQGIGRWILPRITHSVVGEQFRLDGWEVDAFPIGPEPVTV